MFPFKTHTLILLSAIFLALDFHANAQQIVRGQLTSDDALHEGSFVDKHTFFAEGKRVQVFLRSDTFDPALYVNIEGREQMYNDDCTAAQDEGTNACLSFIMGEGGNFEVWATTYENGQSGKYELSVIFLEAGDLEFITGSLDPTDTQSGKGEYYDTHTITLEAGAEFTVEMKSESFDNYLVVVGPNGERHLNDDTDGTNARVKFYVDAPGMWQVFATSTEANMTGNYELIYSQIRRSPGQTYTGALAQGDTQLVKGEYFDTYTFSATEGQQITLDLQSNEFDAYLVLVSPSGTRFFNDDTEGSTNAQLIQVLGESGTWTVLATSLSVNVMGTYTLVIRGLEE